MDASLAINLRHIRAFLAVARLGSFTRAANQLALSQPALTISIRQLEDAIGMTMFNRTTRRVSLTVAGQEFLPLAERLVQDFQAALTNMKAIADFQKGRVSVAAIPSVAAEWLPATVAHFARTFPNISIELISDNSPGVYRRVNRKEVSFGFVGLPRNDNEISVRKLFSEPIGLVSRYDHPLAAKDGPIRWRELQGATFIDAGNDDCIKRVLDENPELADTLASTRYRINKANILVAMIEEGIGVTAMPLMAIPREHRRKVSFKLLTEPTVTRSIYLIRRRDHMLSLSEDMFVSNALSAAGPPAEREQERCCETSASDFDDDGGAQSRLPVGHVTG